MICTPSKIRTAALLGVTTDVFTEACSTSAEPQSGHRPGWSKTFASHAMPQGAQTYRLLFSGAGEEAGAAPAAAPATRARAIRIGRASWPRCLMRASWRLGSWSCACPSAVMAVEAFTVAAGRDPHCTKESPPHRFGTAQTGQVGDLLKGV